MTTDHTDGKAEVVRDIIRAKANLESLFLRDNIADKERLAWSITLLGTVINYLEMDDESPD